MKSMMNSFNNRRLQQPVAAPLAGSEFRELTRQETTTVSGGFVPAIELINLASVWYPLTVYDMLVQAGAFRTPATK